MSDNKKLKEKKQEVLSKVLNNIKLRNAGVKLNEKPIEIKTEKGIIPMDYPELYLTLKQAPMLKGYEVGDKIIFVAEGEITRHDKNDSLNYSKETFNIKIKKIGCKTKK